MVLVGKHARLPHSAEEESGRVGLIKVGVKSLSYIP